jgi:hypothetical protein
MRTIIAGFIAGFVSVLVFHQLGFFISNELGLTKAQLYSHRPVAPYGQSIGPTDAPSRGLSMIVA